MRFSAISCNCLHTIEGRPVLTGVTVRLRDLRVRRKHRVTRTHSASDSRSRVINGSLWVQKTVLKSRVRRTPGTPCVRAVRSRIAIAEFDTLSARKISTESRNPQHHRQE